MGKLKIFRESEFPSVFSDKKIYIYIEEKYSDNLKLHSQKFDEEIEERIIIFNSFLIILEKLFFGLLFLSLHASILNYYNLFFFFLFFELVIVLSYLFIKHKIKTTTIYGDFVSALLKMNE